MKEKSAIIRLLLLYILGILISIDISTDKVILHQALLALFSVVFLVLLGGIALPYKFAVTIIGPVTLTPFRLAAFLCMAGTIVLSFLLFREIEVHNRLADSVLRNRLAFLLLVFFFLFLIQLVLDWSEFPLTLLAGSIAAVLSFLILRNDLAAWGEMRSHHLRIITEAIDRFYIGLNPYQRYASFDYLPLTVLPGMLLSYAPLKLLDIDPRLFDMVLFTAGSVFIYLAAGKNRRGETACLLSVFIFSPVFVLSSNSTLGPAVLTFGLMLFFLGRERYFWGAVCFGWGIAVTPFFLVLLPFLLVHFLKRRPFIPSLFFTAVVFLVAGATLLPFIQKDMEMFLDSVLLFRMQHFVLESYNVAFWLKQFMGKYGLFFLQVVSFFAFFIGYLKKEKTLATCLFYVTFLTFILVVLNHVVLHMFFPFIIVLLIGAISMSRIHYEVLDLEEIWS